MILVDDNQESKKFHPTNTIIVQKLDESTNDTILINWLPEILDECYKSSDVRNVIKNIE